jgi:thioredoxin-dependent peroxiredoxin
MLKVNDKAPLFVLPDDQGGQFSLAEQAGRKVLLVFYPGDDTPVCTKQLCDYRDGVEAFAGLGVEWSASATTAPNRIAASARSTGCRSRC